MVMSNGSRTAMRFCYSRETADGVALRDRDRRRVHIGTTQILGRRDDGEGEETRTSESEMRQRQGSVFRLLTSNAFLTGRANEKQTMTKSEQDQERRGSRGS